MFSLPRAPSDLPKAICYAPLSGAKAVNVERMGREFQRYMYRLEHNISESRQQELQGSDYDSEFGIKDRVTAQTLELDEWDPDLLDLDPSEWKEQDHYAVLGLSKLRWRASSEQIKLAYRRRILEHHPDKKASSGDPHDDRFFKCIQRAYDQLSDPVRRRQYDSVDPQVSFDIPEQADPSHFFEVYAPVFEREARFSKRQPVIDIGGPDSSREHVEAFYKFWSDFDSWRSFEYLDEEKERVENRDEKRWYEKQNRAKRAQRKKEDNARIRKLASKPRTDATYLAMSRCNDRE
ncbi:Zuotin [Spiromyces aspiralis]|uniref:Zuotin n=1 Tax=Spiromyces aspiralis TaxID=68401 RepID=A0ACC1HXM2_9FUNG|nr:Zuotin [Spiromyces aspiralis]